MKANTLKKIEEYGLTDDDIIEMIESSYIKEDVYDEHKLDQECDIIRNKIEKFVKSIFKKKSERICIYTKKWNGLDISSKHVLNTIIIYPEQDLEVLDEFFCHEYLENFNVALPKNASKLNKFLWDFINDDYIYDKVNDDDSVFDEIMETIRKFHSKKVKEINKFIKSLNLTQDQCEWIDSIEVAL